MDGSLIRLPDGSTWRAPSLASADRERVRWYGFPAFVKMAVHHLPGVDRVMWNWHFDELTRHAQALYEGRCTVLNEMLPPGTGKTRINSILFPLFLWTQNPKLHIMTASYAKQHIRELADDTLTLMQSAWFQARWGNLLREQKSAPNIENIRTSSGGIRYALTAPRGKSTGFHGEYFVLDDLIRAQDAEESPVALRKVASWITSSVLTRGRMSGPIKVLSGMQRLAIADPAGELQRAFAGLTTYVELMLPYRFEPERRCRTPFGGDHRKREGELLWDTSYMRDAAMKIERMSGGSNSQQARAQLQQDPTTGDDAIFDPKTLLQRFTKEEAPIERCVVTAISVDPTFTSGKVRKGKTTGDFVAIEVWGLMMDTAGGIRFYCYHSEEARRGFNETVNAIIALRTAWRTTHVLVELAAAGHPIVEELERIGMTGVVGIAPQGGGDNPVGKKQKAKVASAYFKAGLVHFLEGAPWLERKIRNLVRFPDGPHDDDVDTTTQALLWLMREYGFSAEWGAAVGGWQDELRQLAGNGSQGTPSLPGVIDTVGFSVPMLLG
jgi:predicted phage terminase large subunit-like protein